MNEQENRMRFLSMQRRRLHQEMDRMGYSGRRQAAPAHAERSRWLTTAAVAGTLLVALLIVI